MKNKHLESLPCSTYQNHDSDYDYHYFTIVYVWEKHSTLHQIERKLALPTGLKNCLDRQTWQEEWLMNIRQHILCPQ